MELDLQRYSVRTDLAVDAREMAGHAGPIPGSMKRLRRRTASRLPALTC